LGPRLRLRSRSRRSPRTSKTRALRSRRRVERPRIRFDERSSLIHASSARARRGFALVVAPLPAKSPSLPAF
jgi:hypothetical protein